MKNSRVTWGILFVLFGLALAGKAFGLFDFWYMFGRSLVALLFVMIGYALIMRENKGGFNLHNHAITDKQEEAFSGNNTGRTENGGYNHYSGILSGQTVQFVDEVFTGAVINSILGNVQLNLRNAIFNDNAVIDTTCILGGIDIFVPPTIKVVVNCTPILSGVESKVLSQVDSSAEKYTLFIKGTCILGGIEVK